MLLFIMQISNFFLHAAVGPKVHLSVRPMSFANVDDAFKIAFLSTWCGPYECLSIVRTSKLWSCGFFLRKAACFAASRMHAPGCHSFFVMSHWYCVWKQCEEVFLSKGWLAILWQHSCRFQSRGIPFVPHEAFLKAVNAMIAMHITHDAVASVLATSIDMSMYGFYSLSVLVILQSGAFAFVGSCNSENPDSERTVFCDMIVNVVSARSLRDVESKLAKPLPTSTGKHKRDAGTCSPQQ